MPGAHWEAITAKVMRDTVSKTKMEDNLRRTNGADLWRPHTHEHLKERQVGKSSLWNSGDIASSDRYQSAPNLTLVNYFSLAVLPQESNYKTREQLVTLCKGLHLSPILLYVVI